MIDIMQHECDGELTEVGLCVYCSIHGRLYQGRLPIDMRSESCETHDWDDEQGLGFYSICRRCGEREWFE